MRKRLKKKLCKGFVMESLSHYANARHAAWNEHKKRSDEIRKSLKCLAKAAKFSPVRPIQQR